jgi:hypothetical protein
MFPPYNLTTVANVAQWLNIPAGEQANAAPELLRLIQAAGRAIDAWLGRRLPATAYSETRNGMGGVSMPTREWPITAVSNVTVDGIAIPPSGSATADGYTFDRSLIYLRGCNYAFCRGVQNVSFAYIAGHGISNEAQTVPSGGALAPFAPLGPWATDMGVTYTDGTPLAPVAANPGAGQYVPPAPWSATPAGNYRFAAADIGTTVLLSYGFAPAAVEQVCIELVGERYRAKKRIGETTQSVNAGGSVTVGFAQKDLNDAAKAMLAPWRRLAPIA